MEDVQQWFRTLPEGVAEMDITSSHPYYDILIEIRPLRGQQAAPIQIGVIGEKFDIWAGLHGLTGYQCGEDSPARYCEAITSGQLVDVDTMLRGRVIASRTELSLGAETEKELWSSGRDFLSTIFRRGQTSVRRRRYAPY